MDDLSAAALSDLWTAVHESLRTALTRQQFETWFRGMRLREVAGETATFAVPNDFTREWVETYYRDLLRSALLDHTGRALDVEIVVADDSAAREPAQREQSGRGATRADETYDDGLGGGHSNGLSGGTSGGSAAEDRPREGNGSRNGAASPDRRQDPVQGERGRDGDRWGGPSGPLEPSGASEALREPRMQRRQPPARRGPDASRGQLFGNSRYPYFLSDVLLNDDYVFENFVAGPGNQLAHAAAQAVANAPAQAYNPLFLHGSVGLGKTHLLQAICHRVLARRPDTRILYLSCETFVNQFISAVEAGDLDDFRYRYRHVDMLLIDDIHFLARKERTQEEFFHTFNALYNSKKQVVLSCDSPPREIPTLEDRLVSRFKWGLVTEIEQPDHETRISIVRRKADRRGTELPAGVAELIADNIATNVRELEGAVLKVIGYASLTRRPLTLDLAAEALRDVIRPKERKVTLDTIVRAVCEHYGVKPSDLTSKRRQKSISQPRQVCMYLARRLTEASLMEIGGHLGGRDHTTVIYANERIAAELEKSPRMKEDLDAICRRIRAGE